jgi:hypothetical protein
MHVNNAQFAYYRVSNGMCMYVHAVLTNTVSSDLGHLVMSYPGRGRGRGEGSAAGVVRMKVSEGAGLF